MKQREQALLLLRKAAQDEALVDEVLYSANVADEIVAFHCQQAAEKLLKAVLSAKGAEFGRTHHLGSLMDKLSDVGLPLPAGMGALEALTPFGSVFRYEDYDSMLVLTAWKREIWCAH